MDANRRKLWSNNWSNKKMMAARHQNVRRRYGKVKYFICNLRSATENSHQTYDSIDIKSLFPVLYKNIAFFVDKKDGQFSFGINFGTLLVAFVDKRF